MERQKISVEGCRDRVKVENTSAGTKKNNTLSTKADFILVVCKQYECVCRSAVWSGWGEGRDTVRVNFRTEGKRESGGLGEKYFLQNLLASFIISLSLPLLLLKN